jgi:hypothetical protein
MTIKIEDIKSGETFFECEAGCDRKFVATTDAYRMDSGWAVKGTEEVPDGETFTFYVRDGYSHYGPRLYCEPQYSFDD